MRSSKSVKRRVVLLLGGAVGLLLALSSNDGGHGEEQSDFSKAGLGSQVAALVIGEAQARSAGVEPPKLESKGDAAKEPEGADKKEGADEKEKSLSWFSMVMSAVAGLVLFIYGVTRLAQGMAELNTERIRRVLGKFTTNRFAGIGTGAVATTLLESSSVTIIMVIAMVSGGMLTFVQSLAVVLGANIGTAVGAQIIALDIEQYIPILMLGGLLLNFLSKSDTLKKLGIIVLGFGLMFYGLEAIDSAMKPLRDNATFIDAMKRMGENPLLGALVGAVFTVLVQSSSATVAIVITLAGSGMISLPAGVAIMLGAEIGTCADTLVATIGRGRPALRTGVFHLMFNVLSASIGIALAPQLVALVQAVSGGADVGRQIANAQIFFNLVGVVAVVGFLPAIARGLEKLLPDNGEKAKKQETEPAPAT
jgi:phosphate:Na+ symporter